MAAAVAIFLCMGCGSASGELNLADKLRMDSLQTARKVLFEKSVYPEAIRLAETGDIITRMGTDLTSLMFSRVNPSDRTFSHCGLLSIENDSVFVYHAIGGECNPDQKLRRESLSDFAAPSGCKAIGIFSPGLSGSQRITLGTYVRGLFAEGLPFDTEFNLATDERQYCTEMVAKSIGKITGNMAWVSITEKGNLRFIPVENIFHNRFVSEKKRFAY